MPLGNEEQQQPHMKVLEAMEVEMNSMNTNDGWDLEEIPNGAKTVGYEKGLQNKMWLQREYEKI